MNWLLPLVVFLGAISGYCLSIIAPEELKVGSRYFKIMYAFLLGSIVFSFLSAYNLILAIPTGLIVGALIWHKYVRYSYLATALMLFNEHIVYTASLVFMLGFPLISIDAQDYVKNDKIPKKLEFLIITIKRYVWFIPIGLLPFLFS